MLYGLEDNKNWNISNAVFSFFREEAKIAATNYTTDEEDNYQTNRKFVEKENIFNRMLHLFHSNRDNFSKYLAMNQVRTYLDVTKQSNVRTDFLAYFMLTPQMERIPDLNDDSIYAKPLPRKDLLTMDAIDMHYDIYTKYRTVENIRMDYYYDQPDFHQSIEGYNQDYLDLLRIQTLVQNTDNMAMYEPADNGPIHDVTQITEFLNYAMGLTSQLPPSKNRQINQLISAQHDTLLDILAHAMQYEKRQKNYASSFTKFSAE